MRLTRICSLVAALLVAFPVGAAEPEVVAVEKNAPAAFTGMLVSEARFKAYLTQQLRADQCEADLRVTAEQCFKPAGPSSAFVATVGAVLGFVAGGLVVGLIAWKRG